ncbi:MAG: sugar phosphate isomerase/epimerase family protein [Candidatus Bathyarchaeia archaeon]
MVRGSFKVGTVFWHRLGASFVEEFNFYREAGFDGVEVTISEETEPVQVLSARGYLRIEKLFDDADLLIKASSATGLEIHSVRSGLLWKYPLNSSDPSVRIQAFKIIEKGLEIAARLGATALLVVPAVVTEEMPYDETYDLVLNIIKDLSRRAEEESVYLCIENVENNFLLSPLEMRKFIDEVGSDMVGVYLDVGNVLARYQAYPQHWVRILGKRIKKVHIKDYSERTKSITYLFQGDVNWPEVIRSLKSIGYNDYLTAELQPYRFYPEVFFRHLAESIRELTKL